MPNHDLRVAIYARVSGEQQAKEDTIDSQLEAVTQRIASDALICDPELSRSKVIAPRGYIASSYGTALSVKVVSAIPNASSATWSNQSSSVSHRSRSSRITRPPRRGIDRTA